MAADRYGTIWITALQRQEGAVLSGYAPHTETMLEKYAEDGAEKSPSGSTARLLFSLQEMQDGETMC